MTVKIEPSWREALRNEFDSPYFAELARRLHAEKAEGRTIFPPGSLIFRAFDLCPLDEVKVVILGQDPYHGYGQAMGLCFSVPPGVPAPPSLKNIFREIETIIIPTAQEFAHISSSAVRDLLRHHGDTSLFLPEGVVLPSVE